MGVISKLARREQRAANRQRRTLGRFERVRAQLAAERAELSERQRVAMAGLLAAAAPVLELAALQYVGVTPPGVSAVPEGHGETGRKGKG